MHATLWLQYLLLSVLRRIQVCMMMVEDGHKLEKVVLQVRIHVILNQMILS